ncbi:f72fe993-4980-4da0-8abe-6078e8183b03 [Sclerotinia trifoliorum]|uniref:F72fe993-4980-4da0-8abe-6078e8183b03 n=1 Tax=Sclerotinia trifoliorum TaxID=28548 RepID=A0A8H2VMK6_9HELO|nr:f72fe993-4980-4da0-8abe-6078e8183b03 [Sclerotinia trifoliorum]
MMSDTELEKSNAPSIDDSTSRKKEISPYGAEVVDGEVNNNGQVEDGLEYPKALAMVMIVVALSLSIFLVSLDMTIVATAIPKITDQFHGLDLVGWYGSAFFLTVGSFQSTWGKAYKYFPLKITFLMSIFIFELGSLICGVAPNSTALIVGRAIAGLGGAGIASGAYTIIAFAARPQHRAAYTGILGASYGVASVVGPLLGGVFADKLTWRWCFYINLPIGGVAAAIILFLFTSPPNAVPTPATLKEKILQMDLPGTFTIMASLVCFFLALQWGGQTKAWKSADVIGTLVGFVFLIVLFIVIQYFQGERGIIVGRLLKERTVSVGMVYVFFLGGGWFILLYYLPYYFQVVSGVSAAQSGVRNLPMIIGTTIATILSGALISAFGHFVPFMILGAVGATIGCGLLYTLGAASTSAQWIGYQALTGLSTGFAFQIPVISSQTTVSPADLSSVTAMVLFLQTIGGAFFISIAEAAFANRILHVLPHYAPSVSPARVLSVGVGELRNVFGKERDTIQGIIESYLLGLKVTYAMAITCTGIAFFVALGSSWPWKNLKGKTSMGGAA